MKAMKVDLSGRLSMLAGLVTPGNRLVDVGCDHGFLSIYLVQNGICPTALAMDVRTGPLAAAGEHIREYGLTEQIETRLSDGLKEYHAGEAHTMVCAGMGGRLMERILRDSEQKAQSLRELILQPQSELKEFRRFLRENHYLICREDAICEEGKYYFAMLATYRPEEMPDYGEEFPIEVQDAFGPLLLQHRHPVLGQYLDYRRQMLQNLLSTLTAEGSENSLKRAAEVTKEYQQLEQVIAVFAGK